MCTHGALPSRRLIMLCIVARIKVRDVSVSRSPWKGASTERISRDDRVFTVPRQNITAFLLALASLFFLSSSRTFMRDARRERAVARYPKLSFRDEGCFLASCSRSGRVVSPAIRQCTARTAGWQAKGGKGGDTGRNRTGGTNRTSSKVPSFILGATAHRFVWNA